MVVDFNNIKVGDILIINSGDKIAIDGIILKVLSVDESMITGESISVEKRLENKLLVEQF